MSMMAHASREDGHVPALTGRALPRSVSGIRFDSPIRTRPTWRCSRAGCRGRFEGMGSTELGAEGCLDDFTLADSTTVGFGGNEVRQVFRHTDAELDGGLPTSGRPGGWWRGFDSRCACSRHDGVNALVRGRLGPIAAGKTIRSFWLRAHAFSTFLAISS